METTFIVGSPMHVPLLGSHFKPVKSYICKIQLQWATDHRFSKDTCINSITPTEIPVGFYLGKSEKWN